MKQKPVVVISSTARDLPDHRAKVMDACLRADMFPKMMEHLPAKNEDAVQASHALVDEADVYVGIFAHRYGYIPDGAAISVTQMEYERAVERGIPRLLFLWDDAVPVPVPDIDFENKPKLDALKERVKKERVVAFFKSPDDLRGLVVHSLDDIKKQLDADRSDETGRPPGAALAESLHYVSEIPQPPEAYIAHPYTLLQVRGLVGRKAELELLTDWVTGKRDLQDVRIFNVVAIGGMGKSALTWTWFNEVAPQEMKPLAGRIWWSFYESDATFENFVTRSLAYVSRRPLEEVMRLPFSQQEDRLLYILNREPFLFALDGLERILTAYARLNAAYLRDEDTFDEELVNRLAGAYALPKSAGQSFVGKHKLRMTADPRVGRFLRELARIHGSRVLISTRLYPADLQAPMGDPSPGCTALFLPGLRDQDALELWRAFGAKGSREVMLPLFRTFDKHPLLIQLLAYEVADFHDAPGDFDAWKAANPGFNPFGLDLTNVQSHVLTYAMRGLSAAELRALHITACFRMPASINSLKALLIRTNENDDPVQKPFLTLRDLDHALTALEDRGLLGWDRRSNRYDLHPIVRGVIWSDLDTDARTALFEDLRSHFEAMPSVRIRTFDDLTPAIELYNILIGLELYDEAFHVFRDRLNDATLYQLGASHIRAELLEALFPDGPEALPRLDLTSERSFTISALALAYDLGGRPSAAVRLYRLAAEIDVVEGNHSSYTVDLCNSSAALHLSGHLVEAENAARSALVLTREHDRRFQEGVSLYWIGYTLTARGRTNEATVAFQRSMRIRRTQSSQEGEGVVAAFLAELALCQGEAVGAKDFADQAWKLAAVMGYERAFIRAARLQGTAALNMNDYAIASERLHHALFRARAVSLVEEELPTLIALAELHRQQRAAAQACAMLSDIWDAAERGPYPLFHADALNVLAQIEWDAGNRDAAVETATKAYRLAWCDGPPFAYHWGLEKAKAHLAALGAPEPEMPPFDESQHEPMPEVEINPPDEFGGADEEIGEEE
jgi:tetratricopeptide (TPR) repeat protein